ncbi:Protein of unknown function [Pyronema omphalodes CBS 100304]|uniref:Uncharacterized protein n=1 Tax=Pyronema omphalodes (strain CBS 100304) TaxID=1076935 RepID=U4LUH1_PYROM|nr:Protein of unknown function [Pyronema omphalodes CBS 100304]
MGGPHNRTTQTHPRHNPRHARDLSLPYFPAGTCLYFIANNSHKCINISGIINDGFKCEEATSHKASNQI